MSLLSLRNTLGFIPSPNHQSETYHFSTPYLLCKQCLVTSGRIRVRVHSLAQRNRNRTTPNQDLSTLFPFPFSPLSPRSRHRAINQPSATKGRSNTLIIACATPSANAAFNTKSAEKSKIKPHASYQRATKPHPPNPFAHARLTPIPLPHYSVTNPTREHGRRYMRELECKGDVAEI